MHPSVQAEKKPDHIAMIMARSGETVTYGELEARSNQGAQLFRALGLKRGDGIAMFMENNRHFMEIYWAAQRSGLYLTPISSRLTAGEVAYIVRDCGAKIFISSTEKGDVAEKVVADLPDVAACYSVNGTVPGFRSYEEAIAAQPAERIADESGGDVMLYSSGTTGRPKGVRRNLPDASIDAEVPVVALLRGLFGFNEETIYLSPAPLYHAAPIAYCGAIQRMGGTIVIMEDFDAEQALANIEKFRITHSQWVPTMFVRMLKLPEEVRGRYDLSSHIFAIHAAAPCPKKTKEDLLAWWGPIVHEYYGGSEGNGITYVSPQDWLSHKGTVGRALLGEIKVLDDEGNELPQGEAGTIYFAGGPEFTYHNDPKKTAESRNDKGWSTLGDIGYLDEDGFLYLTDRKAYMIISGGVNIYPQETEDILITHPKVADAAVIGVPNEDFGEEVKAVVQPMNMAEAGPELEQELIAFCKQNLSAIKAPRSVDFEAELPRHPTGKLYKRLLKDRYWGNKDSRIV